VAIRVTIWNERIHERRDKTLAGLYPDSVHDLLTDQIRA
jgi:trehalose utilization protein